MPASVTVYVEEVTPLSGYRIGVRLEECKVKQVHALCAECELEHWVEEGYVVVDLPTLREYEVVVLDALME